MTRVTGFDSWSGERLVEFIAELEEVADPTKPFATLDAARAEVERRANRNAIDRAGATADVADDVQNPAPQLSSKGRDPLTDSIPTSCREDVPNLAEDIAWIEAERDSLKEMNDRHGDNRARREALAAANTAMAELRQGSEEKHIPEGFDFETDTSGLYVRYEPLGEWPGLPKFDGLRNIKVSAFERVFSDGTSNRVVNLVAGPTELTYESTHLLIDYLRDAARSLVVTDSDGGQ